MSSLKLINCNFLDSLLANRQFGFDTKGGNNLIGNLRPNTDQACERKLCSPCSSCSKLPIPGLYPLCFWPHIPPAVFGTSSNSGNIDNVKPLPPWMCNRETKSMRKLSALPERFASRQCSVPPYPIPQYAIPIGETPGWLSELYYPS